MGLRSILVGACVVALMAPAVPATAVDDRPTPEPVTIRTSQQAATAMQECPPDLQGCTSPREHVRKYKRGYYDRAGASISYSKPLKRKILAKAQTKWNRTKSRPWRSDRYRWRKFRNIDNCWASTYGDIRHACTTGPEKRAAARRGVWVKKVAFCGVQLVPVWFIKGAGQKAIAAIPGTVSPCGVRGSAGIEVVRYQTWSPHG